MAGYRQIHTQIWKDEWFIELEPDEKLLFVYLFSNELSSISGLYKIPIRVMHNETGIELARIKVIIKKFVDQKKIQYEDGTLWIRNMWKYHSNASPRTQTKVWNDINSIPDCQIKRDCIQYLYSIDTHMPDALKTKTKTKTKAETKAEAEGETDSSGDSATLDAAFAEASQTYEKEIGVLTAGIADELQAAVDDCPPGWVSDALHEAARQNKRNWKYAAAILRNWKVDGRNKNGSSKKQRDEDAYRKSVLSKYTPLE